MANPAFELRRTKTGRAKSLFDQQPPRSLPPPTENASPPVPPVAELNFTDASGPDVSLGNRRMATGEVGKARDILAAIRTLQTIERESRPATDSEKAVLRKFSGFGPVALSIFPNPVTGLYKSPTWQVLGEELRSLLTPAEYDSAKRTTFSAFYTSPLVIDAIHAAIQELGVPSDGTILEPGCGVGNFLSNPAAKSQRFIGVELDSISARLTKALYPQHDIRNESFRDTKLPEGRFDGVIGNVPFADVRMDYRGIPHALHDFFISKSLDAVKPGGVLAVVTSRFTMDKQNAAVRESLAERADFLGAIRLPSDAFQREGTSVVTDIVFLRKRSLDVPARHADPNWLTTGTLSIDGAAVPVNQYFLNHPEMVLGTWSRKDTLYGGEGFSVESHGDLAVQLQNAIERLPKATTVQSEVQTAVHNRTVFVPPPPDRHLNEGSVFIGIGDDRAIYQIDCGQGVPVVYSGTALRSDGTMTGKRLAGLIELRDRARRVLQSQNEGWPEEHRDEARGNLNRSYDRFVAAYGPINKTTFSETRDGTTIRRMPNLVKFREDPDAMLVMSLEDYDEVTGKAAKSTIMQRDVVGRKQDVTSVRTAEEGLLVSLNNRGVVDLAYIAELYGKPQEQVIAELGDLIFQNPANMEWETADVYLSGPVRDKLSMARSAGADFARNVASLEAVQPEDVLPGDIDANLGAPWIPVSDAQEFAAKLFQVNASSIPISHLKKDAVWSVVPDYAAQVSVPATSDYGTDRANGTWLFELALNMKSPTIYDTIDHGDREERVVNQQETTAAREKQKQIKERFRSWVFSDPERTERLVRIYNDTYNNLRPRLFDGSHLNFPGMNQSLSLRPHQKDAVWRSMTSGNTLLAHVVGAGKTYTMAATGMKMKQAGLVRKPMYVVPNHLLEQFSREFMQLYPNARLLVAAKEDLSRDKRKMLTAKIATGEWDGIIVTHSSFERIGMSTEYQQRFLQEQIDEYDQLLIEHAGQKTGSNRNMIKTIEKQKAAREEKLKNLLAEDKKDDGLVFDELGVDHVFIDEAHYFKNLETPTKMDRVAGIQTGGSERAFDVYMKARYLGELHPGHGVTFATGTPISNTMVEMYTMQRFLDPEGLKSRGIEHFDAWAATFGEVVDTMEISPDGGGLRQRSRFARFMNLPELQQMFRAFADVQTAEMLNLPRPTLAGGKATVVASPMSPAQDAIQLKLVERYERLRSQKVDPRVDNALAITTDGRKLATDARMVDPDAPDFPESKTNKLVENVFDIWQRTADTRRTQMIFSDIGVNPTAWNFSPYQEIIDKLIERGIPPNEIATIGEADSDAKKQVLFEKVRNGTIRIILGSTQKMGTGTNVQKRLIALHHLDAPWKPAEVEQRDGRILRQGNENSEVEIFRYVTAGSFDAYMWQALETKAKFISQIMTGENANRRAEDIGGQELSYAEVKAIASGNPAVLTLAEADAELQRLAMLRKNHLDDQYVARQKVRDLPADIARMEKRRNLLETDRTAIEEFQGMPVRINNRPVLREDVPEVLQQALDAMPLDVAATMKIPIGQYRGLNFGLYLNPGRNADVYLEGAQARISATSSQIPGPRAVLNALERIVDGYSFDMDRLDRDMAIASSQLRNYEARVGKAFEAEGYFSELTGLRNSLRAALSDRPPTADAGEIIRVSELVTRIKTLRAANNETSAIVRSERRSVAAEEPVTVRIRRRQDGITDPDHDAATDVGHDHRHMLKNDWQRASEQRSPSEAEMSVA
ncbi:MAG: DEAD/DEAH box helicase family protein [Planctomyces sp.]